MSDLLIGTEYDHDFIRNNPIATVCPRCRAAEQINAPSLENVYCFWCSVGDSRVGGRRAEVLLKPADEKAYRDRLANLWRHTVSQQLSLPLH